ncbi:MAG: M15 family metallopeptidase [Anaerolineales bacterium]
MRHSPRRSVILFLSTLTLAACATTPTTGIPATLPLAAVSAQTATPPPSSTPVPSVIAPIVTPTPTAGECALYDLADPLLTLVDRQVALPRDFEPSDLITPTLPARNAWILPLRLRAEVEPPLVSLLDASNQVGLTLKVVSAYRSYIEQALAYQKWAEWYPDRANAISAAAGHSEHQLGTAVDFTTPEIQARMPNRFHVSFALTPEGQWLAEHASEYGFVLSYPEWATEQTGYEWEPWHYRYVGVEVAQHLAGREPPITVSGFIQQCQSK